MTKQIKVGDRVEITRVGGHYSTYRAWAERYNLTKWAPYESVTEGEKGVVLSIGLHDYFDSTVVGIELDNGKQVMMCQTAVKLVPRLKLPLVIKADHTYVMFRSDGGYVTLVSATSGAHFDDHCTEQKAINFIEYGVWKVIGGGDDKAELEVKMAEAEANLIKAQAEVDAASAALANYKPSYLE